MRHDPWSAAKWFNEAEKLEAAEEEAKNQDALHGLDVAALEMKASTLHSGTLCAAPTGLLGPLPLSPDTLPTAAGMSPDGPAIIIINTQGNTSRCAMLCP